MPFQHMMKHNEKVFAYKVQGHAVRYCTPLGWVKAVVGMAMQNPSYAPHIKKFLADFDSINSFVYNQSKNISHFLINLIRNDFF